MAFVVDASVAGAWLLPDEENKLAERLLNRAIDDDVLAPDILLHELRNLLLAAERRGRIPTDFALTALNRFGALQATLIQQQNNYEIIHLARQYQLSAYDAAYLALAQVKKVPLATLDKKLIAAVQSAGIQLIT